MGMKKHAGAGNHRRKEKGAKLRVKGEVKGCKRKKKKLFDNPSGVAEKIPK